MRVIVQRVLEASVTVAGKCVARIGRGMLVLAGFEVSDGPADIDWMARKLAGLRIFSDQQGMMNLDIAASNGEILVVSQFTLFASVKKGHRPSWCRAASAEIAQSLFQQFVTALAERAGRPVQCGIFGAEMQVSLINDGPVTLAIDSKSPE